MNSITLEAIEAACDILEKEIKSLDSDEVIKKRILKEARDFLLHHHRRRLSEKIISPVQIYSFDKYLDPEQSEFDFGD
jgi:hypothetical protein